MELSNISSVIVGYGEIGQAVHNIIHTADVHDPRSDIVARGKTYDILIVCFPYTDMFIRDVIEYQKKFSIRSTVIFSTVPIGTSKVLSAVHTPVEGKHPNLANSLKTFTRWIGGTDQFAIDYLKGWFESLTEIHVYPDSNATEFLKLRSTTLYGMTLEYARYENEVCKSLGIDYELVQQYDLGYNYLYKVMDMEFSRSILTPPKGKLGGHCVLPNAKLLDEWFPFPNILKRLVEDAD